MASGLVGVGIVFQVFSSPSQCFLVSPLRPPRLSPHTTTLSEGTSLNMMVVVVVVVVVVVAGIMKVVTMPVEDLN
jgi:hypothetical protein